MQNNTKALTNNLILPAPLLRLQPSRIRHIKSLLFRYPGDLVLLQWNEQKNI